MQTEQLDFLRKLIETPSPSSGESVAQRAWLDYVKSYADRVETDAYGNALALLHPEGSPKILLAAHIDEIGFQVQYVDERGFIYFTTVGGSDPLLARGQRVRIHHEGRAVLGVIGSLAIHLQDREGKQDPPKWHELFIDIGAQSQQEALERISIGDLITYDSGFAPLHEELWVGRACDDRVGAFVVAEALRRISARREGLQACVIAASTIQEENGLFGASMVGYSAHPDAAVVVDVGHATDIPIADKKRHGDVQLGKGPILSRGSVNHPLLVRRLAEVARKHRIPYQQGIDPRRSGTDADAIFLQRGGIPTVALGIPNRYMHSPVEVVHLQDLETLAEWLSLFVGDLQEHESFRYQW
ncbi:tetrahedral aminopeptidase [Methylacidimicrobium cyclopophantes]|uniref:Tetrahedral aminopeptidase n=1 Tax=Methylacidimicrobium cyclopophantes TaxID=1041766 RepID=A0A5E6MHH4_9BACT|nr:M42 family metallopeptidase [Methylacidimicrobium cyclopophantes]VVM07347.1 tetrahedral aminopeptidase [Methylacidimicrobium cyclopophantes]